MKGNSNLLCADWDDIDNSVFKTILSLGTPKTRIDRDMQIIREATDAIKSVMERNGLKVCHPWKTEDGNICYHTEDHCSYCTLCK